MKRGVRLGLLAIAALGVACRGIVGIEDLTVVDGGLPPPPRTHAGGGDAGGGDANKEGSVPPGPPAPPPPTAGDASSCAANNGTFPTCMKCCRDQSLQGKQWEDEARATGCLCEAGLCQSECATEFCTVPPSTSAPSPTCGSCLDHAATGDTPSAACNTARSTCASGTACNVVVACFATCKGLP